MSTTGQTGGATRGVVDAVASLPLHDLPADAARVARHCLLDFLGCALAGSGEPLTGILVDELAGGDVSAGGEAAVLGRRLRARAVDAALVNGAAGHALDFDDTHLALSGHPTVPVAPAVLAVGERAGASGAEVLAAFVAGVETECRIGLLVNPGHYASGFHATATLGAFGAAAACAHLLDLDDDRRLHALGLAGTQAAGLKAVFGTMSKPLHAGRAAATGVLAASLAARGFTSSTGILEAPQGFAATHTDGPADPGVLAGAAGRFLVRDTLFKHHAACYLTHAAIEAALLIGREEQVRPADVDGADVVVHRSCLDVCAIPEPRTGLEGKFSLRATVAMALLGDDTADPAAYTDDRMGAPDLVDIRDRVLVVPDGPLPATAATVRVRTTDGRTVERGWDTGVPDTDLDLQGQRLGAKFRALAVPVIGDDRAAEVLDMVERLSELKAVADLTAACQP